MANDAYVNKVIYGDRTLIDISDSNFDISKLPAGSVVYAANGQRVVGSAIIHNVYTDTTANWNSKLSYIPEKGDIIIYTDKGTIYEDDTTKLVPGVKIGDGLAYCVDLPFVGDDMVSDLIKHINDNIRHIAQQERIRWNNKVNCQDTVQDETLILNRN